MMRRQRIQLQGSRGFTLLEVVMALGLSGLVMMAIFGFFTTFGKQVKDLGDKIEVATDIESGQRIMLRDLKLVDTSFGVITANDDSGKPFFEHFPDVIATDLPNPVSRKITLKAGGTMSLTVVLQDQRAAEISSLNYDPSWAFEITDAGISGTGTVTFRGVNWNQKDPKGMIRYLRDRHPLTGPVQYPGFWNPGQLLMFDTPAVFRLPAQMHPSQRKLHAPRPLFFIGIVGPSAPAFNASFVPNSIVQNEVHQTHPMLGTSVTSAEDFLRWLPSNAGGMPNVRLRPVELVRYSLEVMFPTHKDEKEREFVRLWRQTLMPNGTWTQNGREKKFVIAERLKSVQFRRTSVADKTILFEISTNVLP